MPSSLTTRVALFWAAVALLVATNPLHITAMKNLSSSTTASYKDQFFKLWLSMDNKSTQDYYLFSIRNTRTSPSFREVGLATKWFKIKKTGMLGRLFKTRALGGKEDPFLAVATLTLVILIMWWYMSRHSDGANFMSRHLTASRHNLENGRLYVLWTSSISHADPIHLLFNLYLFQSLYNTVFPAVMSSGELCIFLFASGVFAAAISVLFNTFLLGKRTELLGFSGCCYSLLAVLAVMQPDAQWHMYGMTMNSSECLFANLAFDVFVRRGAVDIMCHAGGMLYGYLWVHACRNDWGTVLCAPWSSQFFVQHASAWEIDERKISLVWFSMILGVGVMVLCMVTSDSRQRE